MDDSMPSTLLNRFRLVLETARVDGHIITRRGQKTQTQLFEN